MPLVNYLKQVFSEFSTDKGGQMGAAFAYTAVFAMVPFFVVVISVMGLVLGEKAANGTLFEQIQGIVGTDAAKTIQQALAHINQGHNGWALILGLIGSVFAAAALTNQLQNAFDTIFAVVPDPKGGIKRMIYVKLKNALTLIIGSLVIAVSVASTAVITAVGTNLALKIGLPEGTLQFINLAGSLAIFILILYLIYRILPDVKLPRKVVLATAVLMAVMFLIGKIVLGYVIGHNATASAYGAAASLITLLLWSYYIGQLLFIGAEGIKVYCNNRSITLKSKRYTLKQKTINIRAKNDLRGRMAEAFARGFTKSIRGQTKK